MTENKPFHLKIKWKNREKTEAIEIVLYDGGQPLCELISVDDARLVRDLMNEQEEKICALNTLINLSLPVWVIEKTINRRIQTTTDENVQKELKNLLEELK